MFPSLPFRSLPSLPFRNVNLFRHARITVHPRPYSPMMPSILPIRVSSHSFFPQPKHHPKIPIQSAQKPNPAGGPKKYTSHPRLLSKLHPPITTLPPPRPLLHLHPLLHPPPLLQPTIPATPLRRPKHQPTRPLFIATSPIRDSATTARPHAATVASTRRLELIAVGCLQLIAIGGAFEAGETAFDG